VDIVAACDVIHRQEAEVVRARTIESSLYGFSRVEARGQRSNGGGDGSTGFHAAKAIRDFGALHYGIDYGGDRFTDNSGTREKEWGRDGVPDNLEKYAANHKVSSVALVTDFEQAAKAIQNGYPVAVCSMQGFSMTQREGYLTPMGSWAHCMMFAGVRWKPYPALLCVNSWGECYSGDVDKTLPVQFQRSSGWVRAETCTRMLKGEDSFALSGYSGFAPRKLEGNWLEGIL
jgi:hypothetical protein